MENGKKHTIKRIAKIHKFHIQQKNRGSLNYMMIIILSKVVENKQEGQQKS